MEKSASRVSLLFILIAAAISLIPVLTIDIPPMPDYPNHYARLWLLAGGTQDPMIAPIYQVDWGTAWTNVIIDVIAALTGPFLSMAVIGPLVLSLALLLPATGIAVLNREIFGGFHWWHALCFILGWNFVYLAGFLNFEIGLGLALLFVAGDLKLRSQAYGVLFLYRAIAATVILVAHPFALLFFTVLLAAFAFGREIDPLLKPSVWPRLIGRIIVDVIPCLLPLVALLLFGPSLPGTAAPANLSGIVWNEVSLYNFASVLMTYFKTYNLKIDALYVLAFAVPVIAAAVWRKLEVHWGLFLVAVVLGILSLFMPRQFMATGGIDTRLPSMMALAFAAGVRPNLTATRMLAVVAGCLACVVVASRVAVIEKVWIAGEENIAAVERAIAQVPAGAALLPMQHHLDPALNRTAPVGRFLGNNMPIHWHYGSLAVVRQKAFIPTLFSAPGKQPIKILPPWNEIAVPEGLPPTVDMLADPANQPDYPYLKDWNTRFDYILVSNADLPNMTGPMPELPQLTLIADEGFAKLYRINRN
ncbi:hypothetical protein [Pararhizobium arenae]|uniref:hypothetical protein n=1 Tax=Pararhizobium arenae TaxID=1856850 RepID=UPI00094B63D1|nr:hypothetical protein [Pararhizobium arenae]